MGIRFMGHKHHTIVDNEQDAEEVASKCDLGATIYVIDTWTYYLIGPSQTLIRLGGVPVFNSVTPILAIPISPINRLNHVSYPVDIEVDDNETGTVYLEYADADTFVGATICCQGASYFAGPGHSNSKTTIILSAIIPANKWHRISSSGTAIFTPRLGQTVYL